MRDKIESSFFHEATAMTLAADIDRFFADRTVQGAIEASRESRPLQICYPSEIPVSRFLAWLLDPSQGHGLNAAVLRRLLTACWDTASSTALPLVPRRRIAPSQMAIQSFADVVIDREVVLTQDSGRLDVLVLVPGMKLLVAIENKVGARESPTQLKRYQKALATRFKDWQRVHVYLDMNGMQPSSAEWIGLDYDWLIEELAIAEQASWLGDEPRQSIREFRLAIDRNGAGDDLPGIDEHHLLDMVLAHPTVFAVMAAWNRDKASRTNLAAEIFSKKKDPRQQLFPLYCRREKLWQHCIPLIAYAALRKAAQGRFADLDWDPKRSAFYFTLKRWARLQREDRRLWPIAVRVREQFDVEDDERFVITSYLDSRSLEDEYVSDSTAIAVQIRAARLNARKMATGVQRASLRVDYASTQQEAATLLCEHLAELAKGFATLAGTVGMP